MLFDLAGAAGLEDKRMRMGTGQHINATEDRAGAPTASLSHTLHCSPRNIMLIKLILQSCTSRCGPPRANSSSWTVRMWFPRSTPSWTRSAQTLICCSNNHNVHFKCVIRACWFRWPPLPSGCAAASGPARPARLSIPWWPSASADHVRCFLYKL